MAAKRNQGLNWANISHYYDALDVRWTSYVYLILCSIYVVYPLDVRGISLLWYNSPETSNLGALVLAKHNGSRWSAGCSKQ